MSHPQRTTVVTGAASGIGAATVALLRSRGEQVIGIDRATGKIRLSRKEALNKTPEVVHNFRSAPAS